MKKNILFIPILLIALFSCNSTKKIGFDKSLVQETLKVKKGETLTISQNSNPTTGFEWKLTNVPNEKILKLEETKYEPTKTTNVMIGSGGVRTWTFKGLKQGTAYIFLKYSKKGGDSLQVTKKYYKIEVK